MDATAPSSPSSGLTVDSGSFRDPDSRVFHAGGEILRGLTADGAADWAAAVDAGLAARLLASGDLVETADAGSEALARVREAAPETEWTAVLTHKRLPFVSYPYEWSFSMLRDAALLQLRVTLEALAAGVSLKDATPYNVQWDGARPVFVDAGSFERRRDGEPWLGYRQFCMQFLYPLLLQAYRGIPFQPWLRGRVDGIGPREARALLRGRHTLRPGVVKHVALHARLEHAHAETDRDVRRELQEAGFDRRLVEANVRALVRLVTRLRTPRLASEWGNYAASCDYDVVDVAAKQQFVRTALRTCRPSLVYDLGCNDGTYARIAAEFADYTVALDADSAVVESLYCSLRGGGDRRILPLVVDLADPSPDLGWRLAERRALAARGAPDLVLALALVHHLAISRSLPLRGIVDWLRGLGGEVVLEFPGRDDPMVRRLLVRKRRGDHPDYAREAFEALVRERFQVVRTLELGGRTRTLYHLRPA